MFYFCTHWTARKNPWDQKDLRKREITTCCCHLTPCALANTTVCGRKSSLVVALCSCAHRGWWMEVCVKRALVAPSRKSAFKIKHFRLFYLIWFISLLLPFLSALKRDFHSSSSIYSNNKALRFCVCFMIFDAVFPKCHWHHSVVKTRSVKYCTRRVHSSYE